MDVVALVGRLLLSLAVVLGFMWLLARRIRKGSKGRAGNGKLVDVLARQQLSRNASIAVVTVGQQTFVVGVTDTQVSMLAEADRAAIDAVLAEQARPARPARSDARRAKAPTMTLVDGRPVRLGSRPDNAEEDPSATPAARNPLAGSALSVNTWRQTFDSLRDLTSRTS